MLAVPLTPLTPTPSCQVDYVVQILTLALTLTLAHTLTPTLTPGG